MEESEKMQSIGLESYQRSVVKRLNCYSKTFKKVHGWIVENISHLGYTNYVVTVTLDPSICFAVYFPNDILLFIEVFIDTDTGDETRIILGDFKSDKPLTEVGDELLSKLVNILNNK